MAALSVLRSNTCIHVEEIKQINHFYIIANCVLFLSFLSSREQSEQQLAQNVRNTNFRKPPINTKPNESTSSLVYTPNRQRNHRHSKLRNGTLIIKVKLNCRYLCIYVGAVPTAN